MENHENATDTNISSKTRVFLHEATQNDAPQAQVKEATVNIAQSQLNTGNTQFFVGEFPEWDLLPQTGFVRRFKKSKI
ncbi:MULTISPECIES: hypothetical protein [Acinetobacter]|jgi:hypothetical protein|uniref:Uncharacterized protein n=1 Tax=Acinetobacter junii SH205 TaxID=575587 RepID=D0SHY7_ACIJU|nr:MULTISPECIES: hypothetical protein [Acinetobacter]APU49009.1 hypothetical protein BVL33_11080 [Acinetobacter junii]AWA47706.1 hypothetical protein CDG57_06695 [Acinetobacter junii]EEY93459.1 hypothetical protein HMPREF0026_00735 [Acinetobacter junii SH205]ENV66729.1 hypothetical protein F948_01654 [Acinetobacter junii CIP 64.5]MCU4408626.1 hypothetical protein [Acinetobacter junii]